jgi:glycosyltransferase involved in cell wall biosynthesis
MKQVSIVIPCYNEEKGIGMVLQQIPFNRLERYGYSVEILVIDNNSSDDTAKIAQSMGAKVIFEQNKGKGNALVTGFRNISKNSDVVVMIDGDNTYSLTEIIRMIEPIDSEFCDVVIGSRLNGKISKKSMSFFNRVGNWIFTFLVRVACQSNVTDVCTGYIAWKRDVIDKILPYLDSSGFSIEMEMIIKMAKLNYEIYAVPISYDIREGKSSLHPIKDGSFILYNWFKYIWWRPLVMHKQSGFSLPWKKKDEAAD